MIVANNEILVDTVKTREQGNGIPIIGAGFYLVLRLGLYTYLYVKRKGTVRNLARRPSSMLDPWDNKNHGMNQRKEPPGTGTWGSCSHQPVPVLYHTLSGCAVQTNHDSMAKSVPSSNNK
jgi:hypothetical protein